MGILYIPNLISSGKSVCRVVWGHHRLVFYRKQAGLLCQAGSRGAQVLMCPGLCPSRGVLEQCSAELLENITNQPLNHSSHKLLFVLSL